MKDMFKNKVIAIVVTYNRKQLLSECIDSILTQTISVNQLVIIDNASTDGTPEMLDENGILCNPNVIYKKMETNTGGSGGFYVGLDIAKDMGGDWIWIMDDDTIPRQDSLEKLLNRINSVPIISFLASCVCGENYDPMNVPRINNVPSQNGYSDWYMHLDQKMVKISSATFVSILINTNAIRKCGLPCRDYFIWDDDIEYTQRLTKFYGDAFLVGDSWVCHKRKNAQSIDIRKENDKNRLKNYFYFYRNTLINICVYQGKGKYIRRAARYMKEACGLLFQSNGWLKFRVIWKGIFRSAGEMRKFRNYIEGQLNQSEMNIN